MIQISIIDVLEHACIHGIGVSSTESEILNCFDSPSNVRCNNKKCTHKTLYYNSGEIGFDIENGLVSSWSLIFYEDTQFKFDYSKSDFNHKFKVLSRKNSLEKLLNIIQSINMPCTIDLSQKSWLVIKLQNGVNITFKLDKSELYKINCFPPISLV